MVIGWVPVIVVHRLSAANWGGGHTKKYRLSVLEWILRVHNQLRLSIAFGGLQAIQFASSSPIWAPSNWRRWPGLASVQDQGTDGTSAIQALKYLTLRNIWEWWDFSHGACMDLKLGLAAVGLWPLVLLLMVVHHLGHVNNNKVFLRMYLTSIEVCTI